MEIGTGSEIKTGIIEEIGMRETGTEIGITETGIMIEIEIETEKGAETEEKRGDQEVGQSQDRDQGREAEGVIIVGDLVHALPDEIPIDDDTATLLLAAALALLPQPALLSLIKLLPPAADNQQLIWRS